MSWFVKVVYKFGGRVVHDRQIVRGKFADAECVLCNYYDGDYEVIKASIERCI